MFRIICKVYLLTLAYCGLDAALLKRWDLFTSDHLVPERKGGPRTPLNLVTACVGCNQIKSGFDPTENGAYLTEETRDRLIKSAKDHIENKRRQWDADFQQMLKEAGRLAEWAPPVKPFLNVTEGVIVAPFMM